ncbi:hypothetical protein [Arthrobacter flavus]|uniref:NACHT domain-containing protein n=1 Tax=Arthrobacter flavus TaxID=95172 RepID=A0ABW4QA51_9MICC
MGKSTTITAASPLVAEGFAAQEVLIDLAPYSSEDRLVRNVLEGPEIRTWLGGKSQLCLTLDSFDEAQTRIDNLHQLLAGYLNEWDTDRLLLRIVSRTSEWPASLEDSLNKHFDEVTPHELLPLRKEDAANLVDSFGLDANNFLSAVEASHAVPLASRPLTLRLLATTYLREGSLPERAADLYEKGLLGLCEEMNQPRRDSSRRRYFGAARLETASRLAAMSAFVGRQTFWLGPSVEAEPEDFTIEECSSDPVTAEAIESALQTGLFTGSGSRRLTWAHATFADFLAARWLTKQSLAPHQVASLLKSDSGRLHPRVRQIAAWLVAISADFGWLIEVDSEAFLLGVEITDDGLRQRIVSAVLAEAEIGRLHHDYRHEFSGLAHPGIADQLRDSLGDGSSEAKRIAIEIARRCHTQPARPELVRIALDHDAALGLRTAAAWAVYELFMESPDDSLLPLLQAPVLDRGDPVQAEELVAIGLLASWPHAISTTEVFSLIDPQHPKNFVGIHSIFITEFAGALTSEDLEPACAWLISKEQLIGDSRIAPLEDAIFTLSLARLDNDVVLQAATLMATPRVRNFEPLFKNEPSAAIRRTIALSVLEYDDLTLAIAATGRMGSSSYLLRSDDFEWLMDEYTSSEAALRTNLARALLRTANPNDRSHVEYVLGLPNDHPAAAVFSSWRDPIDLRSEEADAEREILRIYQETAQKRAAREEATRTADEEIQVKIPVLSSLAKDGDVTAFWEASKLIMVPPRCSSIENPHQPDLTKHPRWQCLTQDCREDLLAAAGVYVRAGRCSPGEWLGTNRRYFPATAGYSALVLLLRESRDTLAGLEPAVWCEWAPIIIAWGVMADDRAYQDRHHLIRQALPHARIELTNALLQVIDGAIAGDLPVVLRDEFELLQTEALVATLVDKLRLTLVPSKPLIDLTDLLWSKYPELLRPLLTEWLEPAQRVANPNRACVAVLKLLYGNGKSDWDELSNLIRKDPDCLKSALLAMPFSDRRKAPNLPDEGLASLYEWLLEVFPPEMDPWNEEGGIIGPLETVALWRDSVLDALATRGSSTAVAVIQRIASAHPDMPWLETTLLRAERTQLERSWQPLTPDQIDRLAANAQSRVVRSEEDLLGACLEGLSRIQDRLQGDTPSSPLLWDTYSKRPKSEDEVSDYLRNELQAVLLGRGAIVNREVQIRRVSSSGMGERTDIRVDAIAPPGSPDELVTIVGEVKGCWNADLLSSIKSQLVDRYMADLHTNYGLYVVIWFDPEMWTDTDYRRQRVARISGLDKLRADLGDTIAEQEAAGRHIALIVLDASLHRPSTE